MSQTEGRAAADALVEAARRWDSFVLRLDAEHATVDVVYPTFADFVAELFEVEPFDPVRHEAAMAAHQASVGLTRLDDEA